MTEKQSIHVICSESNIETQDMITAHYESLGIPTIKGGAAEVQPDYIAGLVFDDLDINREERQKYDFYKAIGKPILLFTVHDVYGPVVRQGGEWVMSRHRVLISRKAILGVFAEVHCGLKPKYQNDYLNIVQ